MCCKKLVCLASSVLVLGLVLTRAAEAADPGLVGWWRLDETSGTTATDSSGLGNDGTCEGDVSWVAGMIGGAWQGDGSGDYIRVPHSESLNISDAVTVSLWAYGGGLPDQLISKGNWSSSYAFRIDDSGIQGVIRKINFRGRTYSDSLNSNTALPENDWTHIAITFDISAEGNNQKIYFNGQVDAENRSENPLSTTTDDLHIGAEHAPAGQYRWFWEGMLDDVQIYSRALTEAEIQLVMTQSVLASPALASNPDPADEAIDVPRDVVLSWTPGEFAAPTNGHRVYLGESFNDVNDTTGGVAQTAAGYAPPHLDFDKTYYWRVDEVNGAPDQTVFKGDIWSFTVEPISIPITNVSATASASMPVSGPENTVNGSGLNELGQHDTTTSTMWIAPSPNPWIQYEFDRAYKLHEMVVWNANQTIEAFFSFGVKEVTIEYSADGDNWAALDGVVTLNQATGSSDYLANTTVDFGGIVAKIIKLSVVSGYGLFGQTSLSEVRFLAIPTDPRELVPTDGRVTSDVEVTLNWRAGREAAAHEVYLGTDPANLTLAGSTDQPTFVADTLDYNQSYYWQVVDVNEAETPASYASGIQSFSTPVYGTVDDFESYSGKEGEEIFMTWLDGYGGDTSLGGSTTGHINGPFVETTIVKNGRQSMPVYIDNDGGFFNIDSKMSSPTFSEVVREFDTAQDWTVSGVKTLSLMFAGSPGLTGQLYCKIGGTKLLYDGGASDLGLSTWHAWNLNLAAVGGNLKDVRELAIGVEGGTSGILYIDDIRLYTQIGETIIPVMPDTANLVAYYPLDGDYQDASGNNRHGTAVVVGDGPIFEPGMTGQALNLNVVGQYVEITGYQGIVADRSDPDNPVQNPFTVACWINTTTAAGALVTWGSSDSDPVGGQYQSLRIEGGSLRAEHGNGNYRGATPVDDGEWHHVALSVAEGANLQVPQNQLYVDGQADSFRAGGSDNVYNITADADVSIGQRASHGDRFFTGSIDDVRIYDRALSASEIAGLAGRAGVIHKPL